MVTSQGTCGLLIISPGLYARTDERTHASMYEEAHLLHALELFATLVLQSNWFRHLALLLSEALERL